MITTRIESTWTASGNEVLPYSHWTPIPDAAGKTRGVIIAVHGLSGAAMDYEPLGAHLLPLGFSVYAPELRGQGSDPVAARRGDLDELETWFADLTVFIQMVRAEVRDAPLFLYGESMGAAILTRYLAQAPGELDPTGLILASPVVAVPQKPSWWQAWIFRFLLAVRPRYGVDVRRFAKKDEAPKLVTRDEAHRAWFETAPHKLTSFTLRFFRNLFVLIDGCEAAAPQVRVPVLVLYAAHDVFISPARVEHFFQLLGSRDKQLNFFPESYHLLLHDHDRGEVLQVVTDWLQARIQSDGGALGGGLGAEQL